MKFTEGHIKAAWGNFRHTWDFKNGALKLPLDQQTKSSDAAIDEKPRQVSTACAIYSVEEGTFDGKPARRIIGKIPDTDVSAVVAVEIDGRPVDPEVAFPVERMER